MGNNAHETGQQYAMVMKTYLTCHLGQESLKNLNSSPRLTTLKYTIFQHLMTVSSKTGLSEDAVGHMDLLVCENVAVVIIIDLILS